VYLKIERKKKKSERGKNHGNDDNITDDCDAADVCVRSVSGRGEIK
jgi:hypothetical protein